MEDKNTTRQTFLSPSKIGIGLQEYNSMKIHRHLTFSASRNNRDKV